MNQTEREVQNETQVLITLLLAFCTCSVVHELRKSMKGDRSTLEGSADCSESRKLSMLSGRTQSDTETGTDSNKGRAVNRKIRDSKTENSKDKSQLVEPSISGERLALAGDTLLRRLTTNWLSSCAPGCVDRRIGDGTGSGSAFSDWLVSRFGARSEVCSGDLRDANIW
jgi:hypothetical protein